MLQNHPHHAHVRVYGREGQPFAQGRPDRQHVPELEIPPREGGRVILAAGQNFNYIPQPFHHHSPSVNRLAAQVEGHRVSSQVVNVFDKGLAEFGQQGP